MAHESITDKLRAILNIKEAIKNAIIFKGVEIKDSTLFEDYAQAIRNIEGGGGISGGAVSYLQPEAGASINVIGATSKVETKTNTSTDGDGGIPPYGGSLDDGFDWLD